MAKHTRIQRGTPAPSNMKVLVIGGGGREHALAWRLAKSSSVGRVYTTCTEKTDNAGLRAVATPMDVPFSMAELYRTEQWLAKEKIDLVVVGPEGPLSEGIVDKLGASATLADAGHTPAIFGPTQEAARIESSKAWAKELMRAASIPTAESRTFHEFGPAREYIENREDPVVIKASGLAAGKGVIVPESRDEAIDAVRTMLLDKSFGDAGLEVVIEEQLKGPEVSVFALFDGRSVVMLERCQDFKRAGEGGTGPNTGGMGAYAPATILDDAQMDTVVRDIVVPTVDAMRREGIEYRGVLYVGLMLTHAGPKVLEYNARFGDPECQVLMRLTEGDFGKLLWSCATGSLEDADFSHSTDACVCVTMASEGYPGSTRTGQEIGGIEEAESIDSVRVFHAGTGRKDGKLVNTGGRVLSVTATAPTLAEARERANTACERISFAGGWYRRDIALEAAAV